MRQSIIFLFGFILASGYCNAQLYSSGNNLIAGNNVGIGTNTPAVRLHLKTLTSGELLRLESTNPTGFGKFTLYNDNPNNYATFTKYGSTHPAGYTGVALQYPYANLLGFGNNGGAAIFSASGNVGIAIFKGGTTKLKFNANFLTEYLGLGGNAEPQANLHFNSALSGDTLKITNATTGHLATDGLDIQTTGIEGSIINRENAGLRFGTNNIERMKIGSDGRVSIGAVTTPAGYRLFVEEGILTEKVKVAVKSNAEWSDYVFAKDYQLATLPEVELYIKQHQHLPGVPSAEEVVANGIDIAKMEANLLQKVEELTLHLIEMNKKMMDMQKRLDELGSK